MRRTVTDLIGPHRLDPCQHLHLNDSPEPGGWHTDDYCGQPWPGPAAIVCYFPQATPPEMGPTVARVDDTELRPPPLPGGFLVMRHDVAHRSTPNVTGRPRFMVKLVAVPL